MSESDSERTLDPTPHRRQQAREQGQVALSQELVSAALLLVGLATMTFAGRSLVDALARLLAGQLGGEASLRLDPNSVAADWNRVVGSLATVLLPVLGLMALVAIGLNLLQTRFLVLPSRVLPDFSRVNPLAGLSRMFSAASAARLMQGILKLALIGAVAWMSWNSQKDDLANLARLDLPELALYLWQFFAGACLKIATALLVLAILDYLYIRWKFERDLRMTPQEVRDEMRNLEGDSPVTRRRRQIGRTGPTARVE